MNDENIKASLIKLRESLNTTDCVDEETLALAQNLEADIEKMLNKENETASVNSSVDMAMVLETKFETDHPVAAGIIREIIYALHKMGV